MANTYFDMLQAVENYYGAGSDQWTTMANWTGYQSTEVAQILKQVPGIDTYVNEAGELVSYSVNGAASSYTTSQAAAAAAANAINSNSITAAVATENMAIPANVTAGATQGTVNIASGATKVATQSKAEVALGHIGTWILGAGVGLKLGVWLDAGFYNVFPEFWDSHNLSELNPETWKDTKVTNWLYDNSGYDDFIAMFNGDDQQVYVDERAFALMAQYLQAQGVFDDGRIQNDVPDSYYTDPTTVPSSMIAALNTPIEVDTRSPYDRYRELRLVEGTDVKAAFCNCIVDNCFLFVSDGPFRYEQFSIESGTSYGTFVEGVETTIDGHTFYRASTTWNVDVSLPRQLFPGAHWNDLMTLMQFGTQTASVPGTNIYDDTPQIAGLTDIDDIIDALKQQFPGIWDESLKQGVLNDDGTITEKTYVPIGLPSGGEDGRPITDPEHPGAVDPTNETTTQVVTKIVQVTPNPTPEPPDPGTGTGNTPTIVLPTGAADALYSIYNPSVAEVKQFGAWLWSSNFVDQLLKVFSDPMQAIISLHKIYAAPHTSGRGNIKVGYLDSGVQTNLVDQQYITIDCGSITLREIRASILDYDPFTDLRLYLPFIGIVKIDTADAMRATINVVYNIDVITGTVVAMVKLTRDSSAGGVIYQYTGSCAEIYPLSSGSYMGVVTGVLGIAAGIAGTIATGGAAAPALIGGAAGLSALHTRVEHSNGFSGNAGAMACKKPYLIISRQQDSMSGGVGYNTGWPTNTYKTLSQCKGFTKVKTIHLSGITGATDTELREIENLLKTGVII